MLIQAVNLFNTKNTTPLNSNYTNNKASYPNLAPLKQDTVSFSGGIPNPRDLIDFTPDQIIKIWKKRLQKHFIHGKEKEAETIKNLY